VNHDAVEYPRTRTARMVLSAPTLADVDDLFALDSDPRVWTHLPSGRATSRSELVEYVATRRAGWRDHGLGTWVARDPDDGRLLGNGGCRVRDGGRGEDGRFWNLGYRFRPEEQGKGLATELSLAAIDAARDLLPEVPLVAYLLEHNEASAALARKLGLRLVWRGPDAGNPDASAIRLVFTDCELTEAQLAATQA
jgi:RimJ/RimL family protein N-acetyltransferase